MIINCEEFCLSICRSRNKSKIRS